jgi:hypothetical protein
MPVHVFSNYDLWKLSGPEEPPVCTDCGDWTEYSWRDHERYCPTCEANQRRLEAHARGEPVEPGAEDE